MGGINSTHGIPYKVISLSYCYWRKNITSLWWFSKITQNQCALLEVSPINNWDPVVTLSKGKCTGPFPIPLPENVKSPFFHLGAFFGRNAKKIIKFQPRDQFSFVSELIPFCFCIHCCSYFLHRGRLSSGTPNKTYHFWFQSLAPKMECTQQKFALEMTREWSFLLSLSKKWPKKIILAMCFFVPSIGLL